MRITLNNKSLEVDDDLTVAALAKLNNLPDKGIAVAVNNEMVARSDWESTVIKDGADIIVIKAVCGG